MSITATVKNNTIKLPDGVHLPDGTTVRIEAIPAQQEIQSNDPIFLLHEHATWDPEGSLSDRDMDRLIYGG
jgi:hypothetical protein